MALSEEAKIVGGVAGAVVALGLAAGIASTVIGDAPVVDADGGVVSVDLLESKVFFTDAGEKLYIVDAELADGGDGVVVLPASEAPCKRRQAKTDAGCVRTYSSFTLEPDGGYVPTVVTVDLPPGDLSRYPAAQLSGDGCEGVACSVWSGTNADAPEAP